MQIVIDIIQRIEFTLKLLFQFMKNNLLTIMIMHMGS